MSEINDDIICEIWLIVFNFMSGILNEQTTGLLTKDIDECDNLKKGLPMKRYKHFREIEPSNKTDFIMLYFAACRSLQEFIMFFQR